MDLALSADGCSLLRALDSLLSLTASAPGAVVVHSCDGTSWPAYVGTVAQVVLIRLLGWDA